MTNEELLRKIEALEREVSTLRQDVRSLHQSSTIPLDVDQSFQGRGFMKMIDRDFFNAASYSDSLSRNIELSGDAETINVLNYPYAWAKLAGSENFFVPLFILAETP